MILCAIVTFGLVFLICGKGEDIWRTYGRRVRYRE